MTVVRLKVVHTLEYEITDDLDKREAIYGTRDLDEALKIDAKNFIEPQDAADALKIMSKKIVDVKAQGEAA